MTIKMSTPPTVKTNNHLHILIVSFVINSDQFATVGALMPKFITLITPNFNTLALVLRVCFPATPGTSFVITLFFGMAAKAETTVVLSLVRRPSPVIEASDCGVD